MGTGRTTALWPPKIDFKFEISNLRFERTAGQRRFSENCTQENVGITIRELKSLLFSSEKKKESDQAARPISISPLNGLLRLHA
jgi:hypothetical protein